MQDIVISERFCFAKLRKFRGLYNMHMCAAPGNRAPSLPQQLLPCLICGAQSPHP